MSCSNKTNEAFKFLPYEHSASILTRNASRRSTRSPLGFYGGGSLISQFLLPRSSTISLVCTNVSDVDNTVDGRRYAIQLHDTCRSFTCHWAARASVQSFYEQEIRTLSSFIKRGSRHLATILLFSVFLGCYGTGIEAWVHVTAALLISCQCRSLVY